MPGEGGRGGEGTQEGVGVLEGGGGQGTEVGGEMGEWEIVFQQRASKEGH